MVELEEGIRRVTFELPLGIDHVHCYLLRASGGGWILVDTGLGTRDPEQRWRPVLDALDAPIERIVITHMHPDHVGGSADIAGLSGAPVFQGREDYEQCRTAWGERSWQEFADFWVAHGVPAETIGDIVRDSERMVQAIHWAEGPELLDAGDTVDGWRVEVWPGHADGHIVLIKGDVVIAGDTILNGITPVVGLYPNSRPDPLADYFRTLARIEELAPRVAYTGHKEVVDDPAGRAREIRDHHVERLAHAEQALDGAAASAHAVSLSLFTGELSPGLRRMATAEALAHLEWLVHEGRARRTDGGYVSA
jgi:glyoxylase-like metal-dependent hydrolase (beta-lactamase superfamily II)